MSEHVDVHLLRPSMTISMERNHPARTANPPTNQPTNPPTNHLSLSSITFLTSCLQMAAGFAGSLLLFGFQSLKVCLAFAPSVFSRGITGGAARLMCVWLRLGGVFRKSSCSSRSPLLPCFSFSRPALFPRLNRCPALSVCVC